MISYVTLLGFPVMLLLLGGVMWLTVTGPTIHPPCWQMVCLGEARRMNSLWAGAPDWLRVVGVGDIPEPGLGGFRNAAADGDLFPVVHIFRIWVTCPRNWL